jgi:hypothetical protein
MSIPKTCHDFLNGVSGLPSRISPFVRNHNSIFPSVVFTFSSDVFPSSVNENAGPRLVRWSASVLSRTIEEAETLGELIIAEAQAVQTSCPQRVIGVSRDYESAYDGERQGIYIHTTELEFFT